MNILGCLDSPTSGRYWFAGEDVSRLSETQLAHVRNRRIGFVFQQFQLLPKLSAWRNVELPLLYRNASDRRSLAVHALETVGLGNRGDRGWWSCRDQRGRAVLLPPPHHVIVRTRRR